ncbi:MAG TPA: glutathione-disulfide reductase [Thermoanaerobaculia bacterium]|nr:glutathione-disulfide reductase [Thermoanaerobaculia bacterium]
MTTTRYDLFVIGGGSGGVRAARMAAAGGARVGLAEERLLGGTCVNAGCIPKKLLVYAAGFRDDFEDAAGYGWSVGAPRFDWRALIENKDREIARLNAVYRRLLTDVGVEVHDTRARLAGPRTVVAGGERFEADHVLVATGGRASRLEFPGWELAVTSDQMFHLDRRPERIAIVGGGYIAAEFAAILNGLGSEVTQLYRGDLFLRGFDRELRDALAAAMRSRGIDLRFAAEADRLERAHGALRLTLLDGSHLDADAVLIAAGRFPNTADLGLELAGVGLDGDGAVVVDEHCRTTVPHVFAVGDCSSRTRRMDLTPVAIAEAMAVVRTVFHGEPTAVDYANVPTAIFSEPCLACVGLTEEEARDRCAEVRVYRSTFLPLKSTLSGRSERTLAKLVVDGASDRVVGAHMLGPDAAEIVQGLAIALTAGATKAHFDGTLSIHPTAAEEFVTMRTPGAP